jgi:ABC-type branched-subunit amino acid transport system ATPase component
MMDREGATARRSEAILKAGQPILKITDLRKNFGGVRAIDGVDIEVHRGEIVAVIGPNGSGKTTTFNVVTGITRPNGGSILWEQKTQISSAKPWKVFELGIARTFQNIRLSPGLSIVENVMTGLYLQERTNWLSVFFDTKHLKNLRDDSRRRAEEKIRFISPQLARNPDKLVAELSYADRRRVEIARAIVSNPKLLLLDEPTAGMNATETDELSADILKVNKSGVTIVLVEHKMKFISNLADRVAVLNFGQKIAEGTYDKIRVSPVVVEAYLGRRKAAA